MMWAILIIGVIIAAFVLPRFGKFLAWCIGGLIGLAIIIAIFFGISSHYERIKEEKARRSISQSEIELVDLRLSTSSYSCTLTGRIRNRSAYNLRSITLLITVRDCIEDKCDIIGQSQETINFYGSIPTQQARDFEEYVSSLSVNSLKGKLVWDYKVLSIEGRE